LGIIEALLDSGYILLPDGEFGNVVGITPPLIVSSSQIEAFVSCFQGLYQKIRNA
jgi:4-aminobutyrate aminotransferase-like enzyme